MTLRIDQASLLIHSDYPQSRSIVITIFMYVFSKSRKTTQFSVETNDLFYVTVELAVGIIDDTCLVLLSLLPNQFTYTISERDSLLQKTSCYILHLSSNIYFLFQAGFSWPHLFCFCFVSEVRPTQVAQELANSDHSWLRG